MEKDVDFAMRVVYSVQTRVFVMLYKKVMQTMLYEEETS